MIKFCRSFVAVMLAVAICAPCASIICTATENPLLDTTESQPIAIGTYNNEEEYNVVLNNKGSDLVELATETTDSEVNRIDSEIESNESETEPSEPETEPSEPETEPSEPETEPSEPEIEPSEPETEPSEPETEPSEPETEPSELETEPSEPETEPTESDEIIPATDLDIEDVESPMIVGKSQLISVAVIPSNSTDTNIIFQSLTPDIASVNAIGRVRALKAGTARIQISAGLVSQTITIIIKDIEGEDIAAEEIDLQYENTMIVGTFQTLFPSLRPANATSDVTYSSNDSAVATVNSFGKVTAISPGTVYISAYSGNASTKIKITVEAEKGATTIDVSDFKDKMKVKETQTITASVFPIDAEDQNVKFYSSDRSVATVSNGGFITAIGKGTATISLYCGNASKRLQLTVYVPTEEIKLPESFIILQPNDTYQINAAVIPEDADQEVTFKSTNTSIATVSPSGLVSAVAPGKVSIILENEDSMKSITIIVNEYGTKSDDPDSEATERDNNTESNNDKLITQINNCADGETVIVSGEDYPFITTEILQSLYNTKKILQIQYDKYIVEIPGSRIRNPHNEFSSQLQLTDVNKGLEFRIGDTSALPGEIRIHFTELNKRYKHLYLFNEASEKYEKLNDLSQQEVKINIAGKYLITKQKIHSFNIPLLFILVGGTLTTAGVATYVVTKKKYLFW